MKKFIFLFTCCLSILFPAYTQDISPNIQDPAAEPMLDRLATLFSTNEAYQVEFRYEVESLTEKYKVEDYGSVIFKGQKYKLKTDEGDVFFNGTSMWTYSPVNEEVYLSKPDPENMDQLLTVPFTLLNNYRKYFKYKLKEEVKTGGKTFHEIDLYPASLESSYSILRVQIEKASGRLHSFTLHQKNGILFRIFINEIIPNVKITDNTFSWNKEENPDVLVIEL